MKLIKEIKENEFIAFFLHAEISSDRFGKDLLKVMKKYDCHSQIINHPDLESDEDNILRKKILAEFRGYSKEKALFKDFPNDITWYRAKLSKYELQKVKYINWDYWLDISNNTRLPMKAIDKIKKEKIETKDVKRFISASDSLKDGNTFPSLILVKDGNVDSDLVVLEGHLRLTAYCFDTKYIPESLEVIIGVSDNITMWGLY